MLDLEFDQEQELLRQTVRDVLAKHCGLDVVRQMEDDPIGYPASLTVTPSKATSYWVSEAIENC